MKDEWQFSQFRSLYIFSYPSLDIATGSYAYSCYKSGTVIFEVIGSSEEQYVPQLQRWYQDGSNLVVWPCRGEDGAGEQQEFESSGVVDND